MQEITKNDRPRKNDTILCDKHQVCSGCQFWNTPWSEQKTLKINHLQNLLDTSGLSLQKPIQYLDAGPYGLRDRLDFTLENGLLGLYNKDKTNILDLSECLQLSPALQSWLSDFRKIVWPMKKASFRLRVSPKGQRGVWIDCANIEIKNLLDGKNILYSLMQDAFVEVGQRRKVPELIENQLKLAPAQQHPWFETWLSAEESVPLYCQVASFTQPSHRANQLVAQIIRDWVQNSKAQRVLEFGSGIGNLTFPALASAEFVTACEIDEGALSGLRQSLVSLPKAWQHLQDRVEIHAGDFQRKLHGDFSVYDLVLANPPRSGLMHFLDPLMSLEVSKHPEFFIYMSCYPESLVKDLARLQSLNYQIKEMLVLDQFPQTTHSEVFCLLQK